MNIVLVDDESDILEIQRDALSALKLDIHEFTSPQAAWTYIQNHEVALVVTDWSMPEMTGMDLLFRIRGLAHPPHVIILTAYGTIERAVQAINLGAFNFLEKPFGSEELLSIVKTALPTTG